MGVYKSDPQNLDNQLTLSLQPGISYYLRRLLRANLSQLKSVVAPGAAVKADSFNDLNAVIKSLYLEPDEIRYAVRELDRLALIHQHLDAQRSIYEQEIQTYEEKIYWLLGYKYVPQHQPNKILIVDDNIDTLKLLGRIFKREGYQVCTTAQSTSASSLVHAFMPNLILMNVDLPEMSGFKLCKKLKASTAYRDIPVLFLSSSNDIECINQGLAAGGLACIIKPFNLKKFLDSIKQLLGDSPLPMGVPA